MDIGQAGRSGSSSTMRSNYLIWVSRAYLASTCENAMTGEPRTLASSSSPAAFPLSDGSLQPFLRELGRKTTSGCLSFAAIGLLVHYLMSLSRHTLRQLKFILPGGLITYYLGSHAALWRIVNGEARITGWDRYVARGTILSSCPFTYDVGHVVSPRMAPSGQPC